MNKRLLVFVLLATNSALALNDSSEIATVMGSPDSTLGFVQNMVKKRIALQDVSNESEVTTAVYSVLSRVGVTNATAVQLLPNNGTTTQANFENALRIASKESTVVYTIVGPMSNELCQEMSRLSNNVFVTVSGNERRALEPQAMPACLSSNIICVAGLNQADSDLRDSANYGALIRIAAPSFNIPVVLAGGAHSTMSNTSVASALVAGRLATFARTHQEFFGATLANAFISENSEPMANLAEKVRDGRVLK
jgi:hypothetical protein